MIQASLRNQIKKGKQLIFRATCSFYVPGCERSVVEKWPFKRGIWKKELCTGICNLSQEWRGED
jgi:hypothetical protein